MESTRRTFLTLTAAGLAAPALINAKPSLAKAQKKGKQITGVYTHQVGNFEVTALLDGALLLSPDWVVGYDEAKAADAFANQHLPAQPSGHAIPVNGYLVNTGEKLIAIDCGTTDDFTPTTGNYHKSLAQAGVTPDQIDHIITTHLHVDHIGGLIDAHGAAIFPNADVITNQTEWDFWHDDTILAQADDAFKGFINIARTRTAPYSDRITLAKTDAEIVNGIELVSLPGHTPGHIGVHLRSEGEELLIWGDIIHAPKLQFENPDWALAFDVDQNTAKATRARLLDRVATDKVMVTGMHMDFPGFGHVVRKGDQYQFEAAAWDYNI
ncbi:MBL fold metallo-hydrolase [Amylibacter sp. SFDW26]|uniref:MBL fold metallo-hydrolase n=1 Tax=Amylibacter sp. SFDW26 TaxID=2652722 RepID=UPI00126220C9|nr:MBL fold metallo-hydrolase [Amylibacter sp. SFDW26]KAB7615831.1 MBL fold metallo-hydrolase [Amylibacter sp. SFDW26]